MELSPITIFQNWFKKQLRVSKDKIPSACCLSTIGLDGFPNARFLSLKEIVNNNFIITGQLTSRKGLEINNNNKVALTFWWAETGRQVRIQGTATKISSELSDKYFNERNRDSRIVSIVSNQGKKIQNIDLLLEKYHRLDSELNINQLKRPKNWGGFEIKPIRIEFLEFQSSRFHKRYLYELNNNKWTKKLLQP